MADAFFDECIQRRGDEIFLVVAAVVTTHRRQIGLAVKRLKRHPKLKAKSELKASGSSHETVKQLLKKIADDQDITIYAIIWHGQWQTLPDFEQLYQDLVARAAFHIVRRYVRVDLHLDKRYTNSKQRQQLEQHIREKIAQVPKNIVRVFQADSQIVKEITSADFVAWAYMQRYCNGTDEFYNVFKARLTLFEDLSE